MSIAGGVERAIERAVDRGYETIQIFVKSPSRWQGPPLDEDAVGRFRRARRASRLGAVFAHAAYLINLAAVDRVTLRRSREALAGELERCDRLGLDGLVVHPGAHMGAGEARGIARVAESLARVVGPRPADRCPLLLETTAGQGTVLGHRLEHLAEMRRLSGCGERIGLCLDTCHVFAAGYALDHPAGLDELLDDLDERVGLGSLRAVHLNDSRFGRGSRRDRHANLGKGEIGAAAFRRLLGDPRLAGVPMILETPIGKDRRGHERDFEKLRRWRQAGR